jgi:hypothetical protein
MTTMPEDAAARKALPIATGFVDYFPDAMAAVAELSRIGNDQHNPGKPLHWDRSKSGDESDALMRHFLQRGTIDTDGVRHSAKVAWRAMAMLQKEIEQARQVNQIEPASEVKLTDGKYDRIVLDDSWTDHDGKTLPEFLPILIDVVYDDGKKYLGMESRKVGGWLEGGAAHIVAWRKHYLGRSK